MRDETPSRPGSVLVQQLCHVEYDEHISCVGCILREGWTRESLHRRSKCWSGHRGEDAGDLERSELNELVE